MYKCSAAKRNEKEQILIIRGEIFYYIIIRNYYVQFYLNYNDPNNHRNCNKNLHYFVKIV